VPHRIKYLEMLYDYILGHEGVVMWTGAEILDWYRAQVPAGDPQIVDKVSR
jgi:allantoinase